MKQTFITEDIIIREEENRCGIRYKYELRRFDSTSVASYDIPLYEIYVETEKEGTVTHYRTGGIFSGVEKAVKFFRMISGKLATPRDLPYVVEDCILF